MSEAAISAAEACLENFRVYCQMKIVVPDRKTRRQVQLRVGRDFFFEDFLKNTLPLMRYRGLLNVDDASLCEGTELN